MASQPYRKCGTRHITQQVAAARPSPVRCRSPHGFGAACQWLPAGNDVESHTTNAPRLLPAGGDHAIVQCALQLDFTNEPDEPFFAALAAHTAEYLQLGYDQRPINSVEVQLVQNAADHTSTLNQRVKPMAGYQISRRADSVGCVRELHIQGRTVVVVIDRYTRWADVLSSFQKLLLPILADYDTQRNPLQAVALEYMDQFYVRTNVGTREMVKDVLAPSSYYAGHALEASGAWHSTHGYFEDLEDAPFSRLLHNINLSFGAQPKDGRWNLNIVTQHRAVDLATTRAPVQLSDVVSKTVELAHTRNKNLLAALLTKEAQSSISLRGATP